METEIKTAKKILALALPMSGSQFINVGSGFLCMAMLAALGHEVLAASALIFSTQLSIMVSGSAILFSVSVLVSHAYGGKNYLTIGNYLQQAWTLSLLFSIPVMFLFWHMGTVMIYFGQSKEIAAIVQEYFHSFVWAVFPGFLSTCNLQFGYGIHKKSLMLFTSTISVIILLVSAYIFIFGKFGIPAMGVAGLGHATTAQYSSFFIMTTLVFYFDKTYSRYELFRYRVFKHLDHFAKMFKTGWPIAVQMGGEMLSFFVSGIMIGWLGSRSLAAFQITCQYYFLIVIPIFSLSQASGILVSHAAGSKQFQEIKQLAHVSIAIVLILSGCVACLFLLFPTHLSAFYLDINNPENAVTLHLAKMIFFLTAFNQLFDALRNVLIGILRGVFDTRFPMYLNLLTIWVIGMPLSYILAFILDFGVIGFVAGGMIGMLTAAMVMVYRWQIISKKYL